MNLKVSISELLQSLKTSSINGLSHSQVEERQKQYGKNALPEQKPEPWALIFIRQFQNPLIYILLIAALIILVMGHEKLDAFIISGVLLFNAIIGTIQEGRTRAILESLKHFIKTQSVVIRDGQREIVDDEQLVPGDMVIIQAGERISADMRIVQAQQLMVDESVLTGESRPVLKQPRELGSLQSAIHDQEYMLFKGTYVNQGTGIAVVVTTGVATQIGSIHQAISMLEAQMPLRAELERLFYFILLFIFVLCIVLLAIGLLQGMPFQELLVMLTALFICVIPEGLPVVLTLVLVSGVYRMAKKQILIKNLQAVEGLGRIQVIIVDKTGTLTRNEMMVTTVCIHNKQWNVTGQGYMPEGIVTHEGASIDESVKELGIIGTVLNNSEIDFDVDKKTYTIKGDPTEAALTVLGKKLGLHKPELLKTYNLHSAIPFDSQNQYHAGSIEYNNTHELWMIGAPEKIIAGCADAEINFTCYNNLLEQGLRVIAFAKYSLQNAVELTDSYIQKLFQEKKLQLIGYCGMSDSVRAEVPSVLQKARNAGLKIIMATGDHTQTALKVAQQVGIYKQSDQHISGAQFKNMSNEQLRKGLSNTTVYSRVTPADKLRLVKAYKESGQLVAMTGDGVNDAPSLVAANIGIAMGKGGTQVAQDAADIILLDDSFVNIVNAIKQGRHIFYTLKRVISYFFATNLGEILIVLFALLANLPLPLTAAQILWLNLVTDGFLDVALSMEPEEPGLLKQKKMAYRFVSFGR